MSFLSFQPQPALSIGNVGQLAVDLLVSSTAAERVGYLDDLNLLPCVGNDAYGPLPCGDIALPLEGNPICFLYNYFCFHVMMGEVLRSST